MTLLAVGLPDSSTGTDQLLVLAKDLGYTGLSLVVGGAFFLAVIWPQGAALRRVRWLLGVGVALGLAGAVLGLGASQADLLDLGVGGLGDLGTYTDSADTPTGQAWLARGLLWVLAVPLVRAVSLRGEEAVRHRAWRVTAAVLGVVLVRAVGLTSHADLLDTRVLGATADLVHVLAASLWTGGLVLLVVGVLPERSATQLKEVLPRFSVLAATCVVSVIAAGTVLSWKLVGSVDALTSTGFGQQLLLKLALVAALLLAGAASKSWVDTRLDVAVLLDGDRTTLRPVLASVGAEAVLAITVLVAAALLTLNPPVA